MDKLVDVLNNTIGRLSIVIGFNTSLLLPGSEHHKLHTRLRSLAREVPLTFASHRLNDLSREDSILLFRECLSSSIPDDTQYQKTIERIIHILADSTTPRPLFIVQLLYYLLDRDLLVQSNSILEVPNPSRFLAFVSKIPDELHDLLSSRWQTVLEKFGKEHAEITRIVAIICSLGSVDKTHLATLSIKTNHIQILQDIGILKEAESGIEFFHNELLLFFKRMPLAKDINHQQEILTFVDQENLLNKYFPQYFIAQMITETKNSRIFLRAATDLMAKRISGPFFSEFLNVFVKNISQVSFDPLDIVVQSAMQACEDIKRYKTHGEGLSAYDLVSDWVNEIRESHSDKLSKALCMFHIEYANARFACGKHISSTSSLEIILRNSRSYHFKSEIDRAQYTAHILDRLAVTYRFQSRYEDCERSVFEAYNLSKKNSDKDIKAICTLGVGNYYRLVPGQTHNAIRYWEEAIDLSRTINSTWASPHMVGSVALIETQALIFRGDLKKALKVSSQGLVDAGLRYDHYNLVRLYFCRTLIAILSPSLLSESLDPLTELGRADSICIEYDVATLYWQCMHFRAVYNEITGNSKEALNCYNVALHRLKEIDLSKPENLQDKRVEALVCDAYNFYKNQSESIDDHVLSSEVIHRFLLLQETNKFRSNYFIEERYLPYP